MILILILILILQRRRVCGGGADMFFSAADFPGGFSPPGPLCLFFDEVIIPACSPEGEGITTVL